MAKKIEKTNAARLLDKAKINYNLIPYEFDENDLAAQHVADSLGQDIAKVFKKLLLSIQMLYQSLGICLVIQIKSLWLLVHLRKVLQLSFLVMDL